MRKINPLAKSEGFSAATGYDYGTSNASYQIHDLANKYRAKQIADYFSSKNRLGSSDDIASA